MVKHGLGDAYVAALGQLGRVTESALREILADWPAFDSTLQQRAAERRAVEVREAELREAEVRRGSNPNLDPATRAAGATCG